MDKEEARIEILLAAYNGERFIREQIDSILAQTDDGWHLTLSDDGSTDGTPEILDAYARLYPEKIAFRRAGRRFGNARDHFFDLMRRCGAAYMMFCDQDDVWRPDKVAKTRAAMREAEDSCGAQMPVLVFSDQTPTDAQLRPLAPSLMRYQKQDFRAFDYRGILMQNVVTGGAMMINRALAELGGRCADTSQVVMHDWWLAAVAARFGRIAYIDELLGAYRQHGENSVGAKDVGSVAYVKKTLSGLDELKRRIEKKKRQSQVFLKTYEAQLNADDLAFLRGFGKKHSGIRFYGRHHKLLHGFCRRAGFVILG